MWQHPVHHEQGVAFFQLRRQWRRLRKKEETVDIVSSQTVKKGRVSGLF